MSKGWELLRGGESGKKCVKLGALKKRIGRRKKDLEGVVDLDQ